MQLVRLQRVAETLPDRETTDRGATEACLEARKDEKGNFDGLDLHAEASIREEPGAGKPHARIRAGAVG